MASYGMNDVKNGMKIIVDGYPSTITDTEYVKPGKGQAFTRVKYRNLKTGRTVELTMKSTDSLEAADVMDTDLEYLYTDGEFWHFMNPESHEQLAADKSAMGDAAQWLKGNKPAEMLMFRSTGVPSAFGQSKQSDCCPVNARNSPSAFAFRVALLPLTDWVNAPDSSANAMIAGVPTF